METPSSPWARHWSFECNHTVAAGDGDPVHNVATVTGDHEGGTVSDTGVHDIDVIHPGIDLDKTAGPTSGPVGTTIVYTYAVTNTGDTALFDISVDDDTIGHIGDIASLGVGQTPNSRPRSPSAPPPSRTSARRRAPTSSACP